MEKFIIEGGIPLKGEVTPSGNKNSALPILAATLLTGEPVTLHNLPDIRDVRDMRQLVASLGVKIEDLLVSQPDTGEQQQAGEQHHIQVQGPNQGTHQRSSRNR